MTENTTPKNSSGQTNAEAEAEADKNSVSPEVKKGTRKKADVSKPGQVVGNDATDQVLHSRAVYKGVSRKNLTVHHLQRRLFELGYGEAGADRDGWLGDLTKAAILNWQTDNGHEATGDLTREEFAELFDGDVNVTVVLDTMG